MREKLVASVVGGYEPEVGAAIWRLEDTRERTMRLLRDMPPDYVERDTGRNTIGTILYHIALIETDWLYSEILEEEFPDSLRALLPIDDRDEHGVLSLVRGESLNRHLERLRLVRSALLGALRGMSPDEFGRPRSFPQYDVSPAWVLHHLAQHEAEHRGELGAMIALINERQTAP